MTKELLFSVTASDCEWQYMRGTGAGGQKRNKTDTKVRCIHPPSGAVAESDMTRSQHQNKRDAFVKMINTKEFKAWHKIECARRMGVLVDIEKIVNDHMKDSNLRIEGKKDGKWAPIEEALVND